MALKTISNSVSSTKPDKRSKFENRLRLIAEKIPNSIKGRRNQTDDFNREYNLWRIFCDYIMIRTYSNKITIHTNGDLTHYECKEVKYDEVKYECSDLEFIAYLLDDRIS